MTDSPLRPADEAELCQLISAAAADGSKLRIRGGGSKDGVGRRVDARVLDMSAFSGIVDYDPAELVLTVKAATPLAEVEALLAEHRQMLAFAPCDPAPIFAESPGRATIGGSLAAAISGSQRLTQGAARDHLLGFHAVSGRGETFVAGAKVVKNVTGYDLSKLVSGSWGRLVALTQVSVKVLPRPETAITLLAEGQTVESAYAAMARCLGSKAEVAAAAYRPAGHGKSITALRLQGFAPSVEARCRMLEGMSGLDGRFQRAEAAVADQFWENLTTLAPLPAEQALWRISLPARKAPDFVGGLALGEDQWLMDWGGSLIWLSGDYGAARVRSLAAGFGGHAMLMRAPGPMRDAVPAFHPLPAAVAGLEERIRRAFDPAGVFETGRF